MIHLPLHYTISPGSGVLKFNIAWTVGTLPRLPVVLFLVKGVKVVNCQHSKNRSENQVGVPENRGTPSHHPFLDGISLTKTIQYWDVLGTSFLETPQCFCRHPTVAFWGDLRAKTAVWLCSFLAHVSVGGWGSWAGVNNVMSVPFCSTLSPTVAHMSCRGVGCGGVGLITSCSSRS